MDNKVQQSSPNYKLIFSDILDMKFPEKKKEFENFLNKETLTVLEVIHLNKLIFGENRKERSLHLSYNKDTILYILDFQKKNKLNNKQLAKHFRLSRNTVGKWKRIFLRN